jgi:hypothetical protein
VAVVILAAGLVLRAVLCFGIVPRWESARGSPAAPDSYPDLARTLLREGTLGFGSEGASPTTVRGPAFPAWLAAGIALGGEGTAFLGFWGGLPGLLAAAWIAADAARRFGVPAGLLAGTVAGLHPLPSFVAARLMGDDFAGAAGMAGLLAWHLALEAPDPRRRRAWTAAAGALLAVHALARATGLLAAACAAGFALLRAPRRMAPALALLAIALAPAAAWSVRSSRLAEAPVLVHALGPFNFWVGEAIDRIGPGDHAGRFWRDVTAFVLDRAGQAGAGADPERFWYGELTPRRAAALDAALARAAADRVAGDPLGYAARVGRGAARLWFGAQTRGRGIQYLAAAAPVLLLAAAGAWSARRAFAPDRGLAALLVTVVAVQILAHAATLPMARLSAQLYPELGWLAGAGLGAILRRPGNARPRISSTIPARSGGPGK